jgi:predicted nucleic acid-binding protein
MLLLDTCVISETIKPGRDVRVIDWMKLQEPAELYISAITLGELHYGVSRLAAGKKRRDLGAWVAEVEDRFADRIVVVDDVVARQWGYLRAAHPNVPVADAQIAATALAYGFVFATRNVRHFGFGGLSLVNPWEA